VNGTENGGGIDDGHLFMYNLTIYN
jgi:hypothetical protein